MASLADCTFSEHLPRLRVAALPPHVFALLSKLAADRSADDMLRSHAEMCWHDRAERRASAEAVAQRVLGIVGLGRHLEGSVAPAWNSRTGWIEVTEQISWLERYEHGQTFTAADAAQWPRDVATDFEMTLSAAQVRHLKRPLRAWAKDRVAMVIEGDARVRTLPRREAAAAVRSAMVALEEWLAAREKKAPQGRKSLFTPAWWEYADWVYRHFGRRETNTDIARSLGWVTDVPLQAAYISRKQKEFLSDGRLLPIRARAAAPTP